MKIIKPTILTNKDIDEIKDEGVKYLKNIIELARINPLPDSLMYEFEDYLLNGIYYLKFQKDIYSKYNLNLEQKYFLTTYYVILYFNSDPNDKEGPKILKEICRSIGYQSEEIQDSDFRKRFYYALNQIRKLSFAERVLMTKSGDDFKINPRRQDFRNKRNF